mmetsp:Transcript_18700/g.22837  ORF Transcript_18700/g.22837 Transcript_18700/m.22837 type:complete len:123 (+) Transcript_18700:309-677(+)
MVSYLRYRSRRYPVLSVCFSLLLILELWSIFGLALISLNDSTIHVAVSEYLYDDRDSVTATYRNISAWNTSAVTNMDSLFVNDNNFRFSEDISSWDTSSVTSMRFMFYEARFNRNISSWDVS